MWVRTHTNRVLTNISLLSENLSRPMHVLLHHVIVNVQIKPINPQIDQTQKQKKIRVRKKNSTNEISFYIESHQLTSSQDPILQQNP